MAEVKVPVYGSPIKAVKFDPAAGRRAEQAVADLRVQISKGLGGAIYHNSLLGLQVGDDHPQYTMWAAPEVITATWNFQAEPDVDGVSLTEFIEDVVGDELVQDSLSIRWIYGDTAGTLEAEIEPSLTLLTIDDERAALPNSLRLAEGTNVTFDINTAGELVINATGGGGGGGMTLIGSDEVTVAKGSVTVSSIPGTFSHLMVLFRGRGTAAATTTDAWMQFNTDTGANYDWQQAHFVANASGFTDGVGDTKIKLIDTVAGGTAGANRATAVSAFIPGYSDTAFYKNCNSVNGGSIGVAAFNQMVGESAGVWRNTAAITEVKVFPTSGNWDVGTKLWVYGIP